MQFIFIKSTLQRFPAIEVYRVCVRQRASLQVRTATTFSGAVGVVCCEQHAAAMELERGDAVLPKFRHSQAFAAPID
jgi:hypothetical protein